MGLQVNKAELAAILGISERSLTDWQKEGMPIVHVGERGESNQYDTEQVIAWWIERELKKVREESPRDELYRSQKRLADLQIAEQERTLVPIAEVEPAYERLVLAARQRLLQMPSRLAHELEAVAGAENKRALLEEAIDQVLTELANYDPNASADAAGGAALGPAFAQDRGAVGGGEALPQ